MNESASRWNSDQNSISWDIASDARLPHEDTLEMSGQGVSLIVRYGIDVDGELVLRRHVVWPSLRTIPNNTHGSLQAEIADGELPHFMVAGTRLREFPVRVTFDGVLRIDGAHEDIEQILATRRRLPRLNKPASLLKAA